MYDPTVGKWITEDPIGFDGKDTNLYRYVGNRSIDRLDPNGLTLVSHVSTTQAYGLIKEYLEPFTYEGKEYQPIHIWAQSHKGDPMPEGTDESRVVFPESLSHLVGVIEQLLLAVRSDKCACIGVLELGGHGGGGTGRQEVGADYLTAQNAQGWFKTMSQFFCPERLIVLGGCNIGNYTKRTPNLVDELAETGSDVLASGGYARGSFWGGDEKITRLSESFVSADSHDFYYNASDDLKERAFNSRNDLWYYTG